MDCSEGISVRNIFLYELQSPKNNRKTTGQTSQNEIHCVEEPELCLDPDLGDQVGGEDHGQSPSMGTVSTVTAQSQSQSVSSAQSHSKHSHSQITVTFTELGFPVELPDQTTVTVTVSTVTSQSRHSHGTSTNLGVLGQVGHVGARQVHVHAKLHERAGMGPVILPH